MHMHKNLTLASGSQVRAELLRGAGLTFDVAVSGVDEDVIKKNHTGTPDELALKLAAAKASAVERGGLVVGADQILMCEGRLFDKPATMTAARACTGGGRAGSRAVPTSLPMRFFCRGATGLVSGQRCEWLFR